MAIIYKITNKINGKNYIGKTNGLIEERWKKHLRSAREERNTNRPLYQAFHKYGTENFFIEKIEECPNEISNEREIYWISFYNTFHGEGYNVTLGGEGRVCYDYDLIVNVYNNLQNITETAKILNINISTVKTALISKGIQSISSQQCIKNKMSKPILMLDLNENYIKSWNSIRDASRWIQSLEPKNRTNLSGVSTHIVKVCKNKANTAYGYKWKYKSVDSNQKV